MRVSGNQNHVQQMCALYNKGIGAGDVASCFLREMQDFLKINEKKMVNYLAVPNNLCTLSLSLSHLPSVTAAFFISLYARAKRGAIPADKGLPEVSFALYSCPPANMPQGEISLI